MAKAIPIPSWEANQLNQLSSEGKLYGVNPRILAVIDLAESGGEVNGPGVNSSGYGGYFGLHQNTRYPGGSIPRSELLTNDPSSFQAQAEVAASEFAYLMKQYGNPYSAEQAYQGGSNEGITLFSEYGITGVAGGSIAGNAPSGGKYIQNSQANPVIGFLESTVGDVGTAVTDILMAPVDAAESVVGFGVGLIWTLILRVILTLTFLAFALILGWHLIHKDFGVPGPMGTFKDAVMALTVGDVAV
jgi:hypothetical protein